MTCGRSVVRFHDGPLGKFALNCPAEPDLQGAERGVKREIEAPVAQRPERRAHTAEVAGSNPAWRI